MSDHDDFAVEPIPGLPARPPKGEDILWQGKPDWRALAIRAFHIREIAVYFGIIAAWRVFAGFWEGDGALSAFGDGLLIVAVALFPIGFFAMVAWLMARMTVYTITSKRIVMRYAVALPRTLNIPFSKIDGAESKLYLDGTGDIPVKLTKGEHLAYFFLWPHARPWHLSNPQPMLRGVPDAERATRILASALAAASGEPARSIQPAPLPDGKVPADQDAAPQGLAPAAH